MGLLPRGAGLAIAQLARADGIPAVLVTPWRWDGRALHRDAAPPATALPGPVPTATSGSTSGAAGTLGLWADGDG